jgi:hypothetical protein
MFLDGMEDLFEESTPLSQITGAFGGMAVLHSGMEPSYLEDDDKENIPELVERPNEEDSDTGPEENFGGDSVPSAIYDPEEQLEDEEEVVDGPTIRPGLFDSDSDDDDEEEAVNAPTVRPGLFDSDSDDDDALATPSVVPVLKGLLKPSTYVMPGVDNIDYDRLTIDDEVELEGDDGVPVVITPTAFLDPTTRFEHMNEYGMMDPWASKRHLDVESPKEYELKLKYRKMSLEAMSPAAGEGNTDEPTPGKVSDGNY